MYSYPQRQYSINTIATNNFDTFSYPSNQPNQNNSNYGRMQDATTFHMGLHYDSGIATSVIVSLTHHLRLLTENKFFKFTIQCTLTK